MNERYSERIRETVVRETLPNGLEVYVWPKPGFQKTFATFTTKYGSIDNIFRIGGGPRREVPDGIAHFLEHKMFEEPQGDVFAEFAARGASSNAFTSFERTAYLFSATEAVRSNLDTLLDFVQHPYFTDENVEKEKGIIAQEIRMYDDNAGFRVYHGLLEALYRNHPLRISVAGTVESISGITKELLYDCYRAFYHPGNMNLFVVGGVEPEAILEWVRENQARKSYDPFQPIERIYPEEPEQVNTAKAEARLPVSLPKCLIGLKESPYGRSGPELIRRECLTKIVLDTALGSSSALYQDLYDDKLITDSFGSDYTCAADFGYSMIGGDTPDPEAMTERLRDGIERLKREGLPADEFERSKRKRIGGYLRMLNSPEAIAYEYTRYRFKDMDMLDLLDLYEGLTLEEANERLRTHFDWGRMAVSVVTSGRK